MEIRYWRRSRGYERLDGSANKSNLDPTRKRRFWRRIRIVPKLRVLKKTSPKKFLTRLRDSYVNMMLRVASSGASQYGYRSSLASREYDEKKLVEIYKSMLMAQRTLVHRDVPKPCSDSIVLSPLR
ncbi:hypothetical protein Bca4012_081344 [Brassica carinata]|uniref:Uncharacterized protein n=1 Tax=Brassica carinata TaxID=52824 RepID=A0A8X7VET9_BRACI|nr:hypothetical protein Bca52824_029438 [Brassica carinata]